MISLNSTNWKVWIARIITLFVPLFFCACSDSFIDNQTTINVAQNISQQATTENELYYLRHQIDTINSYYRFYAEEFSEESMVFSDNPVVNEDVTGALTCIPSFGHIGGQIGRWIGAGFGSTLGGVGAIPGYITGNRLGKIVGAIVGAVVGAYIWSKSAAIENSTSIAINNPNLLLLYGRYIHRLEPINNILFIDSLYGSSIGYYHNLLIQEDWNNIISSSFFDSNITEAWERCFAISRSIFLLDFDEEAENVIYQEMENEGAFNEESLEDDVIRERMFNFGLGYEYQIIDEFCEIARSLPVYLYKQYTKDFLDVLRVYENSSSDMFFTISIISGIVSLRMNSFLLWKTLFPHPDDYSASFCFFNNHWDIIHVENSSTEHVFTFYNENVVGIPKLFGNSIAIFFYKEDCMRFDEANFHYQSLMQRDSLTIPSDIIITNQRILESLNAEASIHISNGVYPIYYADESMAFVYIDNVYQ